MGKNKGPSSSTQVQQQAQTGYQSTTTPTPTENEFVPFSQNLNNQATSAYERNKQDYGDIMGAYQNFRSNLGDPTKFSYQHVSAQRPAELGEAYGTLREALPTYREFAQTGGYSPTDIQELRARGEAPIRAAYGNAEREINRSRALGGGGGAPNYIAAMSSAQRQLPQQLADAETGVNAKLAEDIRSGRLAGAAGIRGVGGDIGQLSTAEAGRMLQADLANQGADIQTQGMGEQSLQNLRANQLASMGGQASLYGTTPGLSSMFGNQALQSYQQRLGAENARKQTGVGFLNAQTQAYANRDQPWWQKAIGVGGQVAPFFSKGGGFHLPKFHIPGFGGGGGGSDNPYAGDWTGATFGPENQPNYGYDPYGGDYTQAPLPSRPTVPNYWPGYYGPGDPNEE